MKMGAKKLLYVCLNKLAKIEKNPQQHIKLGIFENEVIMREGNLVRAYEKAE